MRLLAALLGVLTIAATGSAVMSAAAVQQPGGLATVAGEVVGGDVDAMLPASYSNPRSADEAVAWALSQVGVFRDSGYCLRFVDLAYGRPSGPPSAYLVWTRSNPAMHRTSGTPPRGALVLWSSAIGDGHGHIAVSLGDGRMVSTTDGAVSVMSIEGFADSAYLGWMPPYFYM